MPIFSTCLVKHMSLKPLVSESANIDSVSMYSIVMSSFFIRSLTIKYFSFKCLDSLEDLLFFVKNTIAYYYNRLSVVGSRVNNLKSYNKVSQPNCLSSSFITGNKLSLHNRRSCHDLFNTFL